MEWLPSQFSEIGLVRTALTACGGATESAKTYTCINFQDTLRTAARAAVANPPWRICSRSKAVDILHLFANFALLAIFTCKPSLLGAGA